MNGICWCPRCEERTPTFGEHRCTFCYDQKGWDFNCEAHRHREKKGSRVGIEELPQYPYIARETR